MLHERNKNEINRVITKFRRNSFDTILISSSQNYYMKTKFFISALILLLIQTNISAQSGYQVIKTFHIKSDGWWDYIVADPNQISYMFRTAHR